MSTPVPMYGFGGGGAALNFKVVGGTSQPANPKENTIWINTSTPITDWVFSAKQPGAVSGRVWISTGIDSTVEFNALKKNGIQVYPISAKQYVSGAWADRIAKSWNGGKWVDFINYLFHSGYGAVASFKLGSEYNAYDPVITNEAFTFKENYNTGNGNFAYAVTEEPINITNVSAVFVRATITSSAKDLRFGTTSNNNADASSPSDGYTTMRDANKESVYSFNTSTIFGSRYVKFVGNNGATITDIWYE